MMLRLTALLYSCRTIVVTNLGNEHGADVVVQILGRRCK
jgi:hypothetical protein